MSLRSDFEAIRLQPVTANDVPEPAVEHFESHSKLYTRGATLPIDEFDHLFVVDFGVDGKSYIASHIKNYTDEDLSEHEVYLVDINPNGLQVGHGEARLAITNQTKFFRDKPFVGMTRTQDEFKRRGLGVRRLMTMDHATEALFDLPLNSSTFFSDNSARRLWQRLVREGLATKYREGSRVRYRFMGKSALLGQD